MEAHRQFGKSGSSSKSGNDRRTALLIAAASAGIAAVLIYLLVTHYHKNSPQVVVAPQRTVLEAKVKIPAGTPENQLVAGGFLVPKTIPASEVVAGAVSDPATVAGESTAVSIPQEQQLTVGDFTKAPVDSIPQFITRDERGVAFTFDSEHGLTAYLQPTDTVDIMAVQGGSTQLLMKNIEIIANSNGLLILRLTDKQALIVTAASSKYTLWLSMRPKYKPSNSIRVGAVGSVGSIG
jgi:Flp pilus assembly protein CpaB